MTTLFSKSKLTNYGLDLIKYSSNYQVSKSIKANSIRNRLLSILNNTVTLSLSMKSCAHLEQVNLQAEGKTQGCEECEKIGSDWVHLRLCLSCGHVGCCDSSQ